MVLNALDIYFANGYNINEMRKGKQTAQMDAAPPDTAPVTESYDGAEGIRQQQVERAAEGIAAISLFARHGDTVVNMRGVSGKLKDIAKFCPRDLSEEPPEKVHNWTVNILTESGHELSEEEKIFTAQPKPMDNSENDEKKN